MAASTKPKRVRIAKAITDLATFAGHSFIAILAVALIGLCVGIVVLLALSAIGFEVFGESASFGERIFHGISAVVLVLLAVIPWAQETAKE